MEQKNSQGHSVKSGQISLPLAARESIKHTDIYIKENMRNKYLPKGDYQTVVLLHWLFMGKQTFHKYLYTV